MRYRIEKDLLGEKQISAESYYGIHTLRGKENLEILKRGINRQMIKALAVIKKSIARVNADYGYIDEKVAKAIMLSCDEFLNGRLHGQFITDHMVGDGGASINMNANEIIANRANEMLGGKKGIYDLVDPIKDVNAKQTTYDVIPTAGKIATRRQTKKLLVEMKKLQNALSGFVKEQKGTEYENHPIIKHFNSFVLVLSRDAVRLESAMAQLLEINLASLSVDDPKYIKKLLINISKNTGEDFKESKNIFDTSCNLDSFNNLSSSLKVLASDLSKIAKDLRVLIKDYEMIQVTPTYENGTFVILDLIEQVNFYVLGLDTTINAALASGEMFINNHLPLVLYSLFEELNSLRRVIRTFKEEFIEHTKIIF